MGRTAIPTTPRIEQPVGARTVVVFTGEFDVTADAVIVELNQRGVPV